MQKYTFSRANESEQEANQIKIKLIKEVKKMNVKDENLFKYADEQNLENIMEGKAKRNRVYRDRRSNEDEQAEGRRNIEMLNEQRAAVNMVLDSLYGTFQGQSIVRGK